ncbi:MAG: phospholipase C, phosphocholine-specific [Pedobacter sp.]
MNARREFLKKAALLSGAATLPNVIPMSIQKALAIKADPNSTFYDAEHVVILMQENRSFDHMFGTMKGVRGFNDPRPFTLPDQDPVWLQKDAAGNAYAPFHIDINKTKITWQGGLPHSWSDQIAARNGGRYDQWLPVKSLMCLGHYDRLDIPFYYAMADAFTICDHNFCSSLTGTTPNRLFMWTGNLRAGLNSTSPAAVNNSQAESRDDVYVDWETFPEVLEDNGIDWKIYQNEIWTADVKGEDVDDWMGNYGDNAIEYVKRYNVKLSAYFRKHGDPKAKLSAAEVTDKYNKLSQHEKNLIDKAFASNINAPFNYLELAPFHYTDDHGVAQTLNIPKNDIFYQFRSDVDSGKLPAVSWLVAPQRFSDHTSSPLYGTWYVSEAIDILTKNPEVWKKTIFILTYDENDGYFDHIPPYVVPKPGDSSSGKVSANIDVSADYEVKTNSPIGLGYRVPMLIASPWSRGGYVNSQVFDHTSTIMFLEHLFSHKTGKRIKSNQISSWRREICGDLTSAFRPENAERSSAVAPLEKGQVLTNIQNAKNKPAQLKPTPLTPTEITSGNYMPKQETGTRKACALPYLLGAECELDEQGIVVIRLSASGHKFGQEMRYAGAPFSMYSRNLYNGQIGKTWSYAVSAGDILIDELNLSKFSKDIYDLNISGPNGFYRHFRGTKGDPRLIMNLEYETRGLLSNRFTGNINFTIKNIGPEPVKLAITNRYENDKVRIVDIPGKGNLKVKTDLQATQGWYDLTLKIDGFPDFVKQYAGHVETGLDSISDPLMAGLV